VKQGQMGIYNWIQKGVTASER